MITQQVKLNLIPGQVFPRVNASQYDNGTRTLQMILYNGDQVFNIASGMTAVVQGTKPDKTGFQYAATITEGSNIATLDITQQMTAVSGEVVCELVISSGDDRIATVNFILFVEAAALRDDTIISETDLPLIEKAAELAQRIDGIAQQVSDDADRAETAADNAELWASRNPYIGPNGNWFVFDSTTEQYVDSQIEATGPQGPQGVQGEIGPQGPTGPTGNGIVGITKTGTSGLVDTYTITFTDGSTTTFTVTNGQDGQGSGDMTRAVYDSTNAVADAGGIVAYVAAHGGAGTLARLTDVALSNLQDGQTIVYDATLGKWVNGEAPSGGILPHFYIDSESGSTVTVTTPSGDTITPTQISSGHWECDVPDYGVYTVHAVLNGEDATVSVTVDTVKEYHITDNHYSYTLSVYAPTGSTIRVNANSETYTGTGAGLTAIVFALHQASTTYTITNTMDGVAKTDSLTTPATSGESGSKTISWATIDLTYSEDFVGQTINAVSGSTTITKTGSSALSATFYIPTLGEWTISSTVSGQTYSTSVTVSEYVSYNAELSAGFTWQEWVDTASRLSSSDYTSLSDVLEDQEAVRELFLEHACVDYMAEATIANANIETIINTDLAAKWINNSDYALDTLYANTIIKGYMDTADKYSYGEWIITDDTTTPPTWGPKGNVPKMTSNTAPYGEAGGDADTTSYLAFDGDDSTAASKAGMPTSAIIWYKFPTPTEIKRADFLIRFTTAPSSISAQVIYSDTGDASDWHDATQAVTVSNNVKKQIDVEPQGYHLYWGIRRIVSESKSGAGNTIQFYGRELSVSVPTMTGANTPYGEASASSYVSATTTFDAWKAFDGNKGNDTTGQGWEPTYNSSNPWIMYKFPHKVKLEALAIYLRAYQTSGSRTFKLEGSNDGDTFEPIIESFTISGLSTTATYNLVSKYIGDLVTNKAYSYYKLTCMGVMAQSSSTNIVMVKELEFYGLDYSEKEFEEGTTKKWLYDHGVELETLSDAIFGSGSTITEESDNIILTGGTTGSLAGKFINMDFTPYSLIRAKIVDELLNYATISIGSSISTATTCFDGGYTQYSVSNANLPNNLSHDISLINQTKYGGIYVGNSGKVKVAELWLE